METAEQKHQKIFLLFTLGIALPCCVLFYLAYRGIRNDQALQEKETLERHREIGGRIAHVLNDNFSAAEAAYFNLLANFPPANHNSLRPQLDSLKIRYPLVEAILIWTKSGTIQFFNSQLLFVPDGSLEVEAAPAYSPGALKMIQTAWRYEFQEDSVRQALKYYQQALTYFSDAPASGELLNAIARVQKKLALFPEAIATYSRLANSRRPLHSQAGFPEDAAARFQLGALFLITKDSLRAAQAWLDLYRDLINNEWTIERAPYEFLFHQIETALRQILARGFSPSCRQRFDMLATHEKARRAQTQRLLLFQQQAAPRLAEQLSRSANRFALEIDGQFFAVALAAKRMKQDAGWGLLLDCEYLTTQLLPAIFRQHVEAAGLGGRVIDAGGKTIFGGELPREEILAATTGFAEGFPGWAVEIYQPRPELLKTLLASRRSIYLYVFLLLAGILFFGLALTLRSVRRELELTKLKSDFVATISHEFKTPLTAIRQYAELLQSHRVPSEARRRQYYGVLVEQSERLAAVIENVLDFARMEECKKSFSFETVAIGPLLHELAARLQQNHAGFRIQTQIADSLPGINADRSAIIQAITNLLDNAVKYSNGTDHLELRAGVENRHLVIAVQDYGIGMTREEIDKIFTRFYRGGHPATRTVPGSGLGLTLVELIVEAHRGTVHVESTLGKGSTFIIRLPLS